MLAAMASPTTSSSCGAYLAASTIPGAGWGSFAGQDFTRQALVLPGDLIVPLQELAWHNGYPHESGDPANLWDDYYWLMEEFDYMDQEGVEVFAASFGLGAVVNCYFPLLNLAGRTEPGVIQFDRAGLGRDDPGAGAFTPYHNRPGIALKDIEAGSELFVTYGSSYFEDWDDDPTKPIVPKPREFAHGRNLLTRLNFILDRTKRTVLETSTTDAVVDGNGKVMTTGRTNNAQNVLINDLLYVLDSIASTWRSGPLELLPKHADQIPDMIKHGVEYRDYKRSQRSVADLQKNGLCMDHIQEGLSTVPHAGRGAFARRNITADQVVVPIPLLHFGNRSLYEMYEGTQLRHDFVRNVKKGPVMEQLIVNYCFGHQQSTLLLCHYGSGAALVNHSQEKANVRLQWISIPGGNPEWRNLSLSEWSDEKHAGIAFELVATRDIAAGEEILMDYGNDWQVAWNKHVANWKAPTEATWYRPAVELNDDADLVVRTRQEGGYKGLLEVYCREYYRRLQGLEPENEDFYRCEIIERRDSPFGYRYVAEVLHFEHDDEEDKDATTSEIGKSEVAKREVLWDIPRDAVVFADCFYSRDHLQPWAFRQPIGIPEDIMPEAWKNSR